MRLWGANRVVAPALLTVLIALLVVLAGFQYYWLGQLSRGQQEQMRTRIQAATQRFGDAFGRDFAQARTLFQVQSAECKTPETALQRGYGQWQTLATTPALIQTVYWVAVDRQGTSQLHQFDAQNGHLEAVSWPAPLQSWKTLLEQSVKQGQWQFMHLSYQVPLDDNPVLLLPCVARFGQTNARLKSQVAYVLIALNRDVLQQQYVPQLLDQYLAGDKETYHLAIRKRTEPAHLFYVSNPSLATDYFDEPDASAPLRVDTVSSIMMVSIDMDTLNTEAIDETTYSSTRKRSISIRSEGQIGAEVLTMRHGTETLSILLDSLIREEMPAAGFRTDDQRFSILQGNQREVLTSDSTQLQIIGPIQASVNPLRGTLSESDWELVAVHRAGSLKAAANQTRKRNMAISFGILMLLAGSIGLLILTARRAQRLGQQQVEFVAGVSHELRTPLAVLHAAGENLADGIVESERQAQQYGQLIRDESQRLSRMVEQTLALASIQSAERTYQFRQVNLYQIIEKAQAGLAPMLEAGNFAVEQRLAKHLPKIQADPMAVQSALENLLHNAVKYSDTNRHIELSAHVTPANELQIAVRDFGRGIAPADLNHIFEPFYRGAEVMDAQIEGNGIGLSLVRLVMEKHKGRVTVESKFGEGSTFTLHFPIPNTDTP